MPWYYNQRTGELLDAEGKTVAVGYSGARAARNDGSKENVSDTGPIPVGEWHIGEARDNTGKGPVVMKLTPVNHDAYDRHSFLIHGDSRDPKKFGDASTGCIILGPQARKLIRDSGDTTLYVMPGYLAELP